ncbi:MAG: Fic family protein [Lentihominibacter sp.]|jgi:Fic family protein
MRNINYEKESRKLFTPEIVSLLTKLHEYKGKQTLFIEAKPDVLTQLTELAKIQSTDASNRIEGIFTSDARLKKIVQNKTMPRNRSEREIAGYRDVLSTIHENYRYLPVRPAIVLQLHRDLYKFRGSSAGGNFKPADNYINEKDAEGNESVRFVPIPAWETPGAIEVICDMFNKEVGKGNVDPLLLIPMFILDFLCIHPFSDGNGRMSRLLTLLLLYRSDYIVGKYVSIEKIINDSKESYYEALRESSDKWYEEKNDYAPFVMHILGIIAAAYREFESRVVMVNSKKLSKPEQIEEAMKNTLGKVTKREIEQMCPNVSPTTIQRTLKKLQDEGKVIKIGDRKFAAYVWSREK